MTTALKLTVHTPGDSISAHDYVFNLDHIRIGRSASCELQLPFPTVSIAHLDLRREHSSWMIADLGSTNGTKLNDTPLSPDRYVPIQSGDRLTLTDITIDIATHSGNISSTTADESAMRVRRMVSSYLAKKQPETSTSAHLDVLQGPNTGDRCVLSNIGIRPMNVGSKPGPDGWTLTDPNLAPTTLTIQRTDVSFTLTPSSETPIVYLDGYAVEPNASIRLRGGGRIRMGNTTLLFIDPLENYIHQIEALPDDDTQPGSKPTNATPTAPAIQQVSPQTTPPTPEDPTPKDPTTPQPSPPTHTPTTPKPSFSKLEITLALACSILALCAVIFLLKVFNIV